MNYITFESLAHRVLAGAAEKMIERLSKGGKGALNLTLLQTVVQMLGWKIEDAPTPALIKDEYAARNAGLKEALFAPLGVAFEFNRGMQVGKGDITMSVFDGMTFYFDHPTEAKKQMDEFLAKWPDLVNVVEKKPKPPFKKGQIFSGKPVSFTGQGRARVEVKPVWVVNDGFKLTAPNGDSAEFAIPLKESKDEFQLASVWKFLYDHGATETAKKLMEGGDVKKPLKRPTNFREDADYGTCPVCKNAQVIHKDSMVSGMPGMVLHGYNRPGHGYIIGQCPGIKWPPWELSSKGLENFLERHLKPYIKGTEDKLNKAKETNKVQILYADPAKQERRATKKYFLYEVNKDGSLTQKSDEPVDERTYRGLEKFYDLRFEKPNFDRIKKAIVAAIQQNLDQAKQSLEEGEQAVKDWKEQPLLTEQYRGEKAQEDEGLCPGSGQPLTTGTAPNGKKVDDKYNRFGALCSVCKQWVSPSAVRDYRGNGMAKKHRKPA